MVPLLQRSGLAREEAGKPNIHMTDRPLSRASSLPHRFLVVYKISVHHSPLWEPSLLAIAVGLLASMLNVLPLSRASPPQLDWGTAGEPEIQVGYQAASWRTLI